MSSPIRTILISVAFSIAAVALLLLTGEKFNLSEFTATIQIQPIGAASLIPVIMAWWLCMGFRVKILAAQFPEGKKISVWRGTQASLLGLFSAAVTPAATGASFGLGWYLSRFMDANKATAIAVYSVVLDLVFYAWSLPVALFILEAKHIISIGYWLVALLGFGGAGLMLAVAWGIAYGSAFLSKIVWSIFSLRFLQRFRRGAFAFVQRTEEEVSSLRRMTIPTQILLHVMNGFGWIFHFAAFNVVAWALGLPNFDHVAVMAAQSLVVFSSFAAPTPGGGGYFEFALGKVFAAVGISSEARTPLVLMWRFLSFYFYIFIGPLIGGMALLRASAEKNQTKPAEK